MTERLKGFISAAVAWAMALWIFIFTRKLSSGTNDLIKPEFVPRVIALGLIILGIGMFIQALKTKVTEEERKALEEKKAERRATPLVEWLTPLLTLVLIPLQMTLLSGDFSLKSWLKYFVIALVVSVAILFIFRYGFKLKLPVNAWKF